MTSKRETYEERMGAAWHAICDMAGMKHDGLYNVETQSPEFTKFIGTLMFQYMTDMSDNNDAYSTRCIHELATFFEDVALYAKNR